MCPRPGEGRSQQVPLRRQVCSSNEHGRAERGYHPTPSPFPQYVCQRTCKCKRSECRLSTGLNRRVTFAACCDVHARQRSCACAPFLHDQQVDDVHSLKELCALVDLLLDALEGALVSDPAIINCARVLHARCGHLVGLLLTQTLKEEAAKLECAP